jgi:hypothetical protein
MHVTGAFVLQGLSNELAVRLANRLFVCLFVWKAPRKTVKTEFLAEATLFKLEFCHVPDGLGQASC